jgi:hypothetical protein
MCLVCRVGGQSIRRIRYLWMPGPGMGERLFSPEPNPTAPRGSEDPSGLLRIPQVLRRMYRQGRYLAIPGVAGYPWDPQTIPL